jgi:hypothetical protein
LGCADPKGCYNIGLSSGKSLFAMQYKYKYKRAITRAERASIYVCIRSAMLAIYPYTQEGHSSGYIAGMEELKRMPFPPGCSLDSRDARAMNSIGRERDDLIRAFPYTQVFPPRQAQLNSANLGCVLDLCACNVVADAIDA